jgi:hypothetical protein
MELMMHPSGAASASGIKNLSGFQIGCPASPGSPFYTPRERKSILIDIGMKFPVM